MARHGRRSALDRLLLLLRYGARRALRNPSTQAGTTSAAEGRLAGEGGPARRGGNPRRFFFIAAVASRGGGGRSLVASAGGKVVERSREEEEEKREIGRAHV